MPWRSGLFFDLWLICLARHTDQNVKDFIDFILAMRRSFLAAQKGLDRFNPGATHYAGDDRISSGWAGLGMLPIALYLYYLKSCGVSGKVLECGAFKAGSTCCLSQACHYLGLELICADSFEGLPEGNAYYGKGDFKGSLDEVRENVRAYGRPEAVRFIKGWYRESLKGFSEDIMLLFLDVDLRPSVLDVLDNVYPRLVKGAVIFSDGIGAARDIRGDGLAPVSDEARGLAEFFDRQQVPYKVKHTGIGYLALIVPRCPAGEQIIFDPLAVKRLACLTEEDLGGFIRMWHRYLKYRPRP